MLNVEGAVSIAKSLRTDVTSAIDAGTITPGTTLLAAGKAQPLGYSLINGVTFNWSRMIFAGGNQVLSGSALLNYQPI